MPCYNFYILNRQGVCQYYHDWTGTKTSGGPSPTPEDFKLMFGLIWSMKTFAAALDPKGTSKAQVGAPTRIGGACSFRSFQTTKYKLHFLETPSGLKFILTTDPHVADMLGQLQYIYSTFFVSHVLKNPLYSPGEPFVFESFTSSLNKYMRSAGLLAQG